MADVAPADRPNDGETEEQRRMRLRQEEMERLLLDDETQEQQQLDDQNGFDAADAAAVMNDQEQQPLNMNDNDHDNGLPVGEDGPVGTMGIGGGFRQKISYTQSSFVAAAATIVYALRTRGQWYLALVYLSSSKWAFCVLGNALVALAVQTFSYTTRFFLQGGLRLHEAEGLQDFFRWNVTETCLALTMFRSELTVGTACEFLCLILAKCLHHVAVMRQNHLRMTDDAVIPSAWNPNLPSIPWQHLRVFIFLVLLQLLDMCALQYTAQILMTTGPSVSILFAFEAAILLVSAWSHLLLWNLHVLDGLLHFAHDLGSSWGRQWLHLWKEHKATLTFAVELQAQAVQFLFYLCFFGFVLTYYGVPINLFREVYVSFSALKERLVAFFKYRRLMAGMNRFKNPTDEQIEEAGRVCIICRDDMTVHDCKQLPVCKHLFHKSCLREWLTQQQSCPTCRADIAAMQAQETTRDAAAEAAAERQENEEAADVDEGADDSVDDVPSTPDTSPVEEDGDERPDQPIRQPSTADESQPGTNSVSNRSIGADSGDSGMFAVASTETPPPSTHSNGSTMNGARGPSAKPMNPDDSSWCDLPDSTGDQEKSKAVRFADNLSLLRPETPFPALYRVVHARGVIVWDFDVEGTTEPVVVRRIPLGVVVLGEKEEDGFVRVPDGWVEDLDILRVYSFS